MVISATTNSCGPSLSCVNWRESPCTHRATGARLLRSGRLNRLSVSYPSVNGIGLVGTRFPGGRFAGYREGPRLQHSVESSKPVSEVARTFSGPLRHGLQSALRIPVQVSRRFHWMWAANSGVMWAAIGLRCGPHFLFHRNRGPHGVIAADME
jgi:hypothetical protein